MAGFTLGEKARAAGYRLRGYETIGSTNTEAMTAARAGDPGSLWLAALKQTEGRGRRGRPWESPSGNLAASLLVVTEAGPALAATLGFVAGVALREALGTLVPAARVRLGVDGVDGTAGGSAARIALKWPNDVVADGAKLAGILLEAEPMPEGRHAIVVGIGVNVVAAPEGLAYPATSLRALGAIPSAEAVFAALSETWVDAVRLWANGTNVPAVLALWRQSAAGIGAEVAIQQGGEIVRGVFEAVDESGRLILRAKDHRRIEITAGDVHFGATATARS